MSARGECTVQVLPVVGDGCIVPGEDYIEAVDGGEVVLWRIINREVDEEAHTSTFLFDAPDNQPQPGQSVYLVERACAKCDQAWAAP